MLNLRQMFQKKQLAKVLLYLVWVQTLIAMLGSLFFSEILHFQPCVLCWYQRIAMYPLVILLPIGILTRDKKISFYTLPLAFIGLLIAIYHCLLYYQFIPAALAPCIQGVSCTTKYIEWFGFVTIPMLSLLGFVTTIIGLAWHRRLTIEK